MSQKTLFLNGGLLFGVVVYLLGGAVLFRIIEHEQPCSSANTTDSEQSNTVKCAMKVFADHQNDSSPIVHRAKTFNTEEANVSTELQICLYSPNAVAENASQGQPLNNSFVPRSDADPGSSPLSFVESIAFAFSIVTVLGFGRTTLHNQAAQAFYLLYGFIGIPLVSVITANLGQFIAEYGKKAYRRYKSLRERRSNLGDLKQSQSTNGQSDEDRAENELTGTAMFILLLLFMIGCSWMLSIMRYDRSILHNVHAAFRSLTADFAEIVPQNNWHMLPLSLLYVIVGNMLLSMSVDLGAVYLRKIHAFGVRLCNVARLKINFGGDAMRIDTLLEGICEELNADKQALRDLDLDQLVREMCAGIEPDDHHNHFIEDTLIMVNNTSHSVPAAENIPQDQKLQCEIEVYQEPTLEILTAQEQLLSDEMQMLEQCEQLSIETLVFENATPTTLNLSSCSIASTENYFILNDTEETVPMEVLDTSMLEERCFVEKLEQSQTSNASTLFVIHQHVFTEKLKLRKKSSVHSRLYEAGRKPPASASKAQKKEKVNQPTGRKSKF